MTNFFERVKLIDDGGLYDELKRNVEEECGHDEDASTKKLTSTVWERFMNCIIRESKTPDYLMRKKKKHKTRHDGKKKQRRRQQQQQQKVTEIGFEPPADRPEEIKICIENMGTKHHRESVSLAEEATEDKQKKRKNGNHKGKKKQKTNKITKEKKDPNIAKFVEMGLEPPPDMPQEFKDRIQNLGGTQVKLVVQKFIQGTDLTSGHNRLSMSLRQVRNDEFLNEEEKAQLNQRRSKRKPKGIEEVMFVQPCGEVTTLNLSKWEIGASPSYILNGAWHKKVVMNASNDLKPNAVVQIWSFRVGPNSKLGFAMIKVTDGEEV